MKQAWIIKLIKLLVSIFLLWFLTHTAKLDFHLLTTLFYSPFLLICTFLFYLVAIAISTWRWHQLNSAQNINLAYKHTLLPTYLGIGFNNLLPGGLGGDFFRYYFLSKNTQAKKSAVMLSVLFDRITGLAGIFIIVGITTAYKLHEYSQNAVTAYFAALCVMVSFAGFMLYFASSLLPKKFDISKWLQSKFNGKSWVNAVLSLLDAIRIYRHSKKIIAECLVASVVMQIIIASTCMLIGKIMHFPTLSFFDYIIAVAVTQIVNLIPIAPGGFGVGEIAFANILSLLNPAISATYATIFLGYRILGILVYLPGVAVFVFDKSLLQQQQVFRALNQEIVQ